MAMVRWEWCEEWVHCSGDMDSQTVSYMANNGQYQPSSNGAYRGHAGAPVSAPPQGSKLATYMNRQGGHSQQPPAFDINNKMSNMSLMQNRPPTPGTIRKIFEYSFIWIYFV